MEDLILKTLKQLIAQMISPHRALFKYSLYAASNVAYIMEHYCMPVVAQ